MTLELTSLSDEFDLNVRNYGNYRTFVEDKSNVENELKRIKHEVFWKTLLSFDFFGRVKRNPSKIESPLYSKRLSNEQRKLVVLGHIYQRDIPKEDNPLVRDFIKNSYEGCKRRYYQLSSETNQVN